MASAFGHAFSAFALGKLYTSSIATWKFIGLGILCSILPDADVITFALGIPYEHVLGHRGFFHSILFSLILSVFVTIIFYPRQIFSIKGLGLITYFFICTASHGLLDAMTTGGLGIAFFSPWDNTRYFLPWRPIQVSPIGIDSFFSEWGWRVIKSELIWIGIPCAVILLLSLVIRKLRKSTMTANNE